MKLDRVAGGEKDHDLLACVPLEEGEQKKKPLLRGTHHVALGVREGGVNEIQEPKS